MRKGRFGDQSHLPQFLLLADIKPTAPKKEKTSFHDGMKNGGETHTKATRDGTMYD